jgi:hypothetical protein
MCETFAPSPAWRASSRWHHVAGENRAITTFCWVEEIHSMRAVMLSMSSNHAKSMRSPPGGHWYPIDPRSISLRDASRVHHFHCVGTAVRIFPAVLLKCRREFRDSPRRTFARKRGAGSTVGCHLQKTPGAACKRVDERALLCSSWGGQEEQMSTGTCRRYQLGGHEATD